MSGLIAAEPLAHVDYVSAAHPDTLAELEQVEADALFSLAVRVGATRLIDNFLLRGGQWQTGEVINQG